MGGKCIYTHCDGNVKRGMKMIKKNTMKSLELGNATWDMRNVSNGRLKTAEESIGELENRPIEINRTETHQEERFF